MNAIAEIQAFSEEMTAVRRDIRAHPELGYNVNRTADLVAGKLEEWGLPSATVVRRIAAYQCDG